MGYPQRSALRRQCPDCSGALFRKTADPKKPLGQVVCSDCPHSMPIKTYAEEAKAEVLAKAQEILDRK